MTQTSTLAAIEQQAIDEAHADAIKRAFHKIETTKSYETFKDDLNNARACKAHAEAIVKEVDDAAKEEEAKAAKEAAAAKHAEAAAHKAEHHHTAHHK